MSLNLCALQLSNAGENTDCHITSFSPVHCIVVIMSFSVFSVGIQRDLSGGSQETYVLNALEAQNFCIRHIVSINLLMVILV